MWGMRRVPSRVGPVDTTREGAHHTSPAADFPVEPLNDAVPPSHSGAPGTGQAERAGRERKTGEKGGPQAAFHGLTGGVYKARERIHRAMACLLYTSNHRRVTMKFIQYLPISILRYVNGNHPLFTPDK